MTPRLPTTVACVSCGATIPAVGAWDEEGRPWARIGEPAWVSVDHAGRACFRCADCEPAGQPLVMGSKSPRVSVAGEVVSLFVSDDILPESRMRRPVGGIRSPGGTLIPTYCANCGVKWGMVPEEHITFAFVLCQPCAEKHGDIAHTYKEPDSVFWERVHNAQLEEHGRTLSANELVVVLGDPTTTLAKLADEWRAHAMKER